MITFLNFFFTFFLILRSVFLFSLESQHNNNYLRTLNLASSMGLVDTYLINPSATISFPDGLYFQLGGVMPLQKLVVSHPQLIKLGKEEAQNSYNSFGPFLPQFGMVLKKDTMSIYVGLISTGEGNWQGSIHKFIPVFEDDVEGRTYLADYTFSDASYELGSGIAMAITEEFSMHFGASIYGGFNSIDANHPIRLTNHRATLKMYSNEYGLTFGTGGTYTPTNVPWMTFSFNINSGGPSLVIENISSSFYIDPAFAPAFLPYGGNPILIDGYPTSLPYDDEPSFGYVPMQSNFCLRFDIKEMFVVQVNGKAKLGPKRNQTYGLNTDFDSLYYSYSVGSGLDYSLNQYIILGLGILYKSGVRRSRSYRNIPEYISDIKLQSVNFGLGALIKNGGNGMFDFEISMMYPMYLSSSGGQDGVGKFTIPISNVIYVSDIFVSIGLVIKFPFSAWPKLDKI